MKLFKKKNSKAGFTLVETMVAIFILSFVVSGLLKVVADNIFASRYSRNEIIANYLLQEAADYIRNDRDSVAFQEGDWDSFSAKYLNEGCDTSGCDLDIRDGSVDSCFEGNCSPLYYNDEADDYFYSYDSVDAVLTSFKRKIEIVYEIANPDEIDFKITLNWTNGNLDRSKSLQISLLRWQ